MSAMVSGQGTGIETAEPMAGDERRAVSEFTYLLDKSRQLFNGLRDLPQYGQNHWQPHFTRTFDVYTRLWKHQQQNRQLLDARFGLKRWQIGEIASKIGQLYYHYYLRTSETGYLNEAFSFYSAIRQRGYYNSADTDTRPDLCVKKLRYVARFVVVSLLLHKYHVVRDLVTELTNEVGAYSRQHGGDEQEWRMVLQEIQAFVDADPWQFLGEGGPIAVATCRLAPSEALARPHGLLVPTPLALADAILVGNCAEQVKFSELTLDMFRMLQALERTPRGHVAPADRTPPARPQELPPDSALLLYLSASGVFPPSDCKERGPYEQGGVMTYTRRDIAAPDPATPAAAHTPLLRHIHCLHPGDLLPFTRKPLVVVVDSPSSSAYKGVYSPFGVPLLCLLSPTSCPKHLTGSGGGGLLTLFLACPVAGFACLCGIGGPLPASLVATCCERVQQGEVEALALLGASQPEPSWLPFLGDVFIRRLVARFILMSCAMRAHRQLRALGSFPESRPPLPTEDLLSNPRLLALVRELATSLDARPAFV
ncbi:protein SCAI isoform X2 [Lethenteron reissneri]|uniref:protein SCAI isoform X2 n=1 Tax=Lethenteron reissneri TaxID=7753 RepID=UPI002AB62F0D|nr:protein SCAI isoform X2 [Lethenteron reissneri]